VLPQTSPSAIASDGAFVAGAATTVAGGIAKTGTTAAQVAGLGGKIVTSASFAIDYWNYKANPDFGLSHLLMNWAFDAIDVTEIGAPIALAYGAVDNFVPGDWPESNPVPAEQAQQNKDAYGFTHGSGSGF
jgi:hypothetical protein